MGDVAARREARRRRILENSNSRIKKILGVEEKSEISIDGMSLKNNDNTVNEYSNANHIENNEENSEITINGKNIKNNMHSLNELSNENNHMETNSNNIEFLNNFLKQETPRETKVEEEKTDLAHYLINFRVHIIFCMAVSYCILLNFVNEVTAEELYLNKMFVPLIVYEVIFSIFTPPPSISNIQMIFMFAGVRGSSFLGHYLNFLARLLKLVKDVAVYFVFFIFTDYLLNIF